MRAAGWTVSGVGAAAGLAVVAYALVVADFAGSATSSALGDQTRTVLVGIGIAAVALAVGAGLRHSRRWTTYVFVALAALLGLAALWWAAGELLG
ncbi:hypothetical protein [Demequina sp. NBRC 110053]|uniref:hypothetical protein n=1 Tax=Demequina sp. NBRC 110053 TaxID=1570342 RepID=UPI0011849A4F|nr:hypothetical protein [Demequina sp. NBRC 110053]